jgi:hypothetical protein
MSSFEAALERDIQVLSVPAIQLGNHAGRFLYLGRNHGRATTMQSCSNRRNFVLTAIS